MTNGQRIIASVILTVLIATGLTTLSHSGDFAKAKARLRSNAIFSQTAPIGAATALDSVINFSSGDLHIRPEPQPNRAYSLTGETTIRRFLPKIRFVPGKTAALSVRVSGIQRFGVGAESEWTLGLSPRLIHDIALKSRSADYTLNLSDIPIRKLDLVSTSAKVNLMFDSANPKTLQRLSIRSAYLNARIYGLGFANVKRVSIRAETGSLVLDLSGPQTTDTLVDVRGELSRFKLFASQRHWVVIHVKHPSLMALNFPTHFKPVDANTWESQGPHETAYKTEINVETMSGKLSVETDLPN